VVASGDIVCTANAYTAKTRGIQDVFLGLWVLYVEAVLRYLYNLHVFTITDLVSVFYDFILCFVPVCIQLGQTLSFIFAVEKLAPNGFCPEKRLPRYPFGHAERTCYAVCAEFFSVQKSLPPIFLLHYENSKLDQLYKFSFLSQPSLYRIFCKIIVFYICYTIMTDGMLFKHNLPTD